MNLAELYREFSILFLRMIKKEKNHETCLYKISIENHCSKFTIEQLRRIGRREKYSRNRVEASNLFRTVNFVINGVFFEFIISFSHASPSNLRNLIISKLSFSLESGVPRSWAPAERVPLLLQQTIQETSQTMRFQMLFQCILLLSRASTRSKLGIVNRVFMSFLRGCCEALRG